MTQTGERVWRNRGGYDHLAPLHVAWRSLPATHPLRMRLRRELIVGYHPVAVHIASRYTYRREDAADLDQVASLGLILAVDRFEPDRGTDSCRTQCPPSPARCCATSAIDRRRCGCLAGCAS
jgi:hypothetical protein